jgi:hypothetical protein
LNMPLGEPAVGGRLRTTAGSMEASRADYRGLVLLLRINAVVLMAAAVAVVMPRSWMAGAHAWLGLGELPAGPVFEYLARSTSMLYAVIGAGLWLLAMDVPRYERLIMYFAWGHFIVGPLLLIMDIKLGMPLMWTIAEGPIIAALGVAMLVLLKQR